MTNAKTTETRTPTLVSTDPTTPTIVTLNDLCAELKLDRREARMTLRLAVKDKKTYPDLGADHLPRQPWQWVKGSPAETQARMALSTPVPA